MKILIKVTKEVLERSKMCSNDDSVYTNCAISLAVREIFPHATVSCGTLNPFGGGWFRRDEFSMHLPQSACYFIREFDQNSPAQRLQMEPIYFEVDVPDAVIERIGIEQAYKILESSPTLELVKPQQP